MKVPPRYCRSRGRARHLQQGDEMPKGTCSVSGCEKPARNREWCGQHYQRWWKTGDPLATRPGRWASHVPSECKHDGCERPRQSQGLCGLHAARLARWGDASYVRNPAQDSTVPPLVRLLDRTTPALDGCLLWEGSTTKGGYAQSKVGPDGLAHRSVYLLSVGPIRPGMTIDHLCHTNDPTCPGGVTCPHRRCLNVAHMEIVSRGENARRALRNTR